MVCRIERFMFIVLVMWAIPARWLPMEPIAPASLGEIFLLAGLLTAGKWFCKGLLMSGTEEW